MSAKQLQVINPFTESLAFELPLQEPAELDQVVARARQTFADWRHSTMTERKQLCTDFIDAFSGMRESIALEITQQMGKPLQQAMGEVGGTVDRARHMISIAEETLADEYLPEKAGFVRYVRHEPKGVVLDIAAWNYPLLIAVNVVVPAILAGNTVIVKHSSRTPLCGEAFAQAFRRAGAPEGLVQAVITDHAAAAYLIQHPGINHVSFTGSVRGGHEVVQSASGGFCEVGLELGGKDPAYVCADAPFDFAVANTVDGAFYNAGQSCCAVERIYVDQAIYRDFVEAFAQAVRAYRLGDPADAASSIGPLASKSAPAFLEAQVKEAVAKGGRLVVSPDEFERPDRGWFYAPAVVADAPQECGLMQEESFGPVIGIRAVSGEEEAIRLMNDSDLGLSASIWTSDPDRAMRVGPQVETGTFYMNRCDYLDPALPWTGVKDTGRGATLSKYGLLNLTQPKSMHLRTQLP
jgi:acyl-CoA reductase-like NAD-dependent aldehyde dehydrogenase